jgi:hypothetical protein
MRHPGRRLVAAFVLTLVAVLAGAAPAGADEPPAAAEPPPPAAPEPAPAPPSRPPPLEGQPAARTAELTGTVDVGSSRQQGQDDVLSKRRELQVSSELTFVTSRGPMVGVPQLYFTDVGLWRTNLAYSISPRWRGAGAVGFLAKQPATIDESFWQSGALSVAFATSRRTSVALGVDAGSLLHGVGNHGGLALSLLARTRMNEYVAWEGRLGAGATKLFFDDDDANAWFAEAAGTGEVQLCFGPCRLHYGASWFGIDLAVPVYHHELDAAGGTFRALDPRTRLGVTLGSYFNVSAHWDMLLTLAWVDRGDPEQPATQLPILDGGFDQVQLSVGLIWHVSIDKCGPHDRDPDCPPPEREFETYE